MYEAYWGLKVSPFDNAPDPAFFYNSPKHEEALNRLLYVARRQKGAAMLTGEIGCGKTLIVRLLMKELLQQHYEIGLIVNPMLAPDELLREILHQLGLSAGEEGKGELIHRLNSMLVETDARGHSTVLIIDDAQDIQETRTFEELRLLLNMQLNNRFLLTLLLVGQPELEVKVTKLQQFEQRIALKYHLDPLDFDETVHYITTRLERAGTKRQVFTYDAIEKIYAMSGGIPRRINNICDLSLLVSYGMQAKEVDVNLVLEVIKDLKWH
ncbi:MAG: AAA family ATPase [Candidatus Tectomicrobia bacterium]|nr:AAA family ATPase [Candidatus Tectomicrobia bacterium]